MIALLLSLILLLTSPLVTYSQNNSVTKSTTIPSSNSNYGSDYCNRPWPSLELFLPFQTITNTRHSRFWEVESIFLQTFRLFWPIQLSKTSLVLGYDVETRNTYHVQVLNSTISGMREGSKMDIRMVAIPQAPYY